MLRVGQRIDRGDTGITGELLHILLGECAEDGAAHKPAEDPRGVFNRLAPAELNFAGRQENHVTAQFTDANLEGNSCAR